jgi:hypothetical protein
MENIDDNYYNNKELDSVKKTLTIDNINEINKYSTNFENIFNNKMVFALQQEDLTRNFLLQQIAKELSDKCEEGYVFNLQFTDFIENIIVLFSQNTDDDMQILYKKLPEFLQIVIYYSNLNNTTFHSWIEQLTAKVSIIDMMNAFNVKPSENKNIKMDHALIEPYCILLDAALQEFNFDTGKAKEPYIFTSFVKAYSAMQNIKKSNKSYEDIFKKLHLFYPVKSRFLIHAITNINFSYFLNGLIILSQKVTRKPNERFFKIIIQTILDNNAYTICGTHHHNLIPPATPFYIMKCFFMYKSFKLEHVNLQGNKINDGLN